MRYVAAYLLAVLGGNTSPKVEDLVNLLTLVGASSDAETAKLVISRLQGKSVEELIAEGAKGLVTVSGGAAPAAAAAPSGGAAAAAPAEDKKKKDEPKEESDDDMGFGLFD